MSSRSPFTYLIIVALSCLSIALAVPASQASNAPATKEEFYRAFDQMLANPTDVDVTMHYAALATELGDYEAAIPPLERILMFNPDLPEVRLEVGVLYYLLNSHQMAKKYLGEVSQDVEASQEIKTRAEQYLARM